MKYEKEYHFNFRGRYEGVEAVSLESAYGYFYSTYPQVSKAELDELLKPKEEKKQPKEEGITKVVVNVNKSN